MRAPAYCLILLTAALIGMYSCAKDQAAPQQPPVVSACDSISVTYTVEVKNIMDTYCAITGCHNAFGAAGGIVLETYEEVRQETESGQLLASVKSEAGVEPMPLGGPMLSAEQIQQLECWMSNGYAN